MTLFLIRHATAGSRNVGDALDHLRQLDEHGIAQAGAIAQRLGTEPIEAVFTSPARRCQQTVAPLALKLGLEFEVTPQLFEGTAPSTAIEFVRSLVGRTAVLCSHGDVIPDVLRSLEIGGTRIDGRGCAKGSIWQLDNTTERIDYATYHGALSPDPAH